MQDRWLFVMEGGFIGGLVGYFSSEIVIHCLKNFMQ